MAEVDALLATLRPLREPVPVALPTAYLLAALIGMAVALLVAWSLKAGVARRGRFRRAAEAELVLTRGLPSHDRLTAQAALLRRVVRVAAGQEAALAQGAAWLTRLDALFATTFFSGGEGRVYGTALYRAGAMPDVEALDGVLVRLLAKLRR